MADIDGQTTDRLPENTSPDTERVVYRGRIRVLTGDYTLSGSWYRATATVDLGQFDVATLPNVDFYYNNGTLRKGTVLTNAGALSNNVSLEITAGTKAGNQSTKLNFYVGGLAATQIDIYYQVRSTPAAGTLFP